ncbi:MULTISPECIES: hypothetical protein [unclassified Nostoc]|uniref:hypothetical protein n=1 Tax=unclassified Nostoc TaxID=2593658 RepID=UPI0025AB2741|nr:MULTISPECIES: hypothetical protein [unclassified Nostoc]MDM9582122.1 hypothetical protein [Nostoc sp. GT001]MDZ7948537.1 hypothetical protein [Nostoc sp. EfeVER01]MDZ7995211.1 hypothetical protein [Nostoc sp. EspVER01]
MTPDSPRLRPSLREAALRTGSATTWVLNSDNIILFTPLLPVSDGGGIRNKYAWQAD